MTPFEAEEIIGSDIVKVIALKHKLVLCLRNGTSLEVNNTDLDDGTLSVYTYP